MSKASKKYSESDYPLHDAAEAGDIVALAEMIGLIPDVEVLAKILNITPEEVKTASQGEEEQEVKKASSKNLARRTKRSKMKEVWGVDSRDDSRSTPLMAAAATNQVAAMKFLIMCGANVNARGMGGSTALHDAAAVRGSCVEAIALLLEHGADLDARSIDGTTPLFSAIASGVTWYCTSGMGDSKEEEKFPGDNMENLAALLKHGADPNAKDAAGTPVLHMAVSFGTLDAAKLLIQHGADVHVKDEFGSTLLTKAMFLGTHMSAAATYERCLREFGKENLDREIVKKQVKHDHLEFMELLLQQGANASAAKDPSEVALHYAAARNNIEAMELFVRYGADVNGRDKKGKTPMYPAAIYGNTEAIEWLLRHGADINAKDNEGKTPLDSVKEERGSISSDDAEEVEFEVVSDADDKVDVQAKPTTKRKTKAKSTTKKKSSSKPATSDAKVVEEEVPSKSSTSGSKTATEGNTKEKVNLTEVIKWLVAHGAM